MTVIVFRFTAELGPFRIVHSTRNNIDSMAELRHRHRYFLNVNQLPAKIRVLGQVGVTRVKVSLGINENDVH